MATALNVANRTAESKHRLDHTTGESVFTRSRKPGAEFTPWSILVNRARSFRRSKAGRRKEKTPYIVQCSMKKESILHMESNVSEKSSPFGNEMRKDTIECTCTHRYTTLQ